MEKNFTPLTVLEDVPTPDGATGGVQLSDAERSQLKAVEQGLRHPDWNMADTEQMPKVPAETTGRHRLREDHEEVEATGRHSAPADARPLTVDYILDLARERSRARTDTDDHGTHWKKEPVITQPVAEPKRTVKEALRDNRQRMVTAGIASVAVAMAVFGGNATGRAAETQHKQSPSLSSSAFGADRYHSPLEALMGQPSENTPQTPGAPIDARPETKPTVTVKAPVQAPKVAGPALIDAAKSALLTAPETAAAPDDGPSLEPNYTELAPKVTPKAPEATPAPAADKEVIPPPTVTPPVAKPASAPAPKAPGNPDVCRPNIVAAYEFLTTEGKMKPAEAAGTIANLEVESGKNLEPRIVQGPYSNPNAGPLEGTNLSDEYVPGKGYGLAQWTSRGRQIALAAFAKTLGLPQGSLKAQLGFLVDELKRKYTPVWQNMENSAKANPDDAYNQAVIVMEGYEAPAEQFNNAKIRGNIAKVILRDVNNC